MAPLPSFDRIHRFHLLTWLLVALHVSTFTSASQYAAPGTATWTLATTATYSAFYLLPALLLGYLARGLIGRLDPPGGRRLVALILIALTGLTHVLLFADRMIHSMYGFHINGFVLDLVLAPGGIASLGASLSTQITAALIVAALLLMQAAAWYFAAARQAEQRTPGDARSSKRWRWLIVALVFATVGERVAFAYSTATNYQPILFASERYPFYLPLSMRKAAKALGIKEQPRAEGGIDVAKGSLNYPLSPLVINKPAHVPNIVWLVAESLRFDMLDPKIMPRTWQFSEQALRLEKHYSGGNLTQMGVFSMFYGLYSPYWFPMLDNRRSPVLMDVLQQENYQFSLYTSQRFTFPAFDKTVFARMNPADLHERQSGADPWKRDEINIGEMLDFIDQRDASRPFMTYMFFEATHANYDFPPESVIAEPYLKDLNYITADFNGQIGEIKNRYINAAHSVDTQIGRVIEHLREKKLLDDTIVIVLGDHGEEFMERGRWGHSAEFNRFQTSTPGVIYVPGQKPRVVTGITSHLDIPATLMPLLGVRNPASDYSLGKNLLAPDFHRDYAVAGDWNRVAYLGEDFKITFPVNTAGAVKSEATDGDDRPLKDHADAKVAIRPVMVEMMKNLTRFTRRPA
ncbi:MAG: sulfatase-like hydrolase/transferase [Propionivibrio sp.]